MGPQQDAAASTFPGVRAAVKVEGAVGSVPAESQTPPKVRGLNQPFRFAYDCGGSGVWGNLRLGSSPVAPAGVAGTGVALQRLCAPPLPSSFSCLSLSLSPPLSFFLFLSLSLPPSGVCSSRASSQHGCLRTVGLRPGWKPLLLTLRQRSQTVPSASFRWSGAAVGLAQTRMEANRVYLMVAEWHAPTGGRRHWWPPWRPAVFVSLGCCDQRPRIGGLEATDICFLQPRGLEA